MILCSLAPMHLTSNNNSDISSVIIGAFAALILNTIPDTVSIQFGLLLHFHNLFHPYHISTISLLLSLRIRHLGWLTTTCMKRLSCEFAVIMVGMLKLMMSLLYQELRRHILAQLHPQFVVRDLPWTVLPLTLPQGLLTLIDDPVYTEPVTVSGTRAVHRPPATEGVVYNDITAFQNKDVVTVYLPNY